MASEEIQKFRKFSKCKKRPLRWLVIFLKKYKEFGAQILKKILDKIGLKNEPVSFQKSLSKTIADKYGLTCK